jgi:hypothetical protein
MLGAQDLTRRIEGSDDGAVGTGERTMTEVPETRWARTVDGACIACQDIGEGPLTLLLVHGRVSHLEVNWEQPRYVRLLARLSRSLRVLVHLGARDGALAGPSEVLVSSTVKDLVAGSGLTFEDRGEHKLKGMPEMWRLYAVAASGAQ